MPAASPLSPAEILFLLNPNSTDDIDAMTVTLLSLLAKGVLRLEEHQEKWWFITQKVLSIHFTQKQTQAPPPHVAAAMDVVRQAQADGGRIAEALHVMKKNSLSYVHDHIAPSLIERGLVERRSWLLFIRTYHHTPAGKAERQRIKPLLRWARAAFPSMLRAEPARAQNLVLALGGALLLADNLKGRYTQLAEVMGSRCSDANPGGGQTSSSDAGCEPDDCNLTRFDFRSFDVNAFCALDRHIHQFERAFRPDD